MNDTPKLKKWLELIKDETQSRRPFKIIEGEVKFRWVKIKSLLKNEEKYIPVLSIEDFVKFGPVDDIARKHYKDTDKRILRMYVKVRRPSYEILEYIIIEEI